MTAPGHIPPDRHTRARWPHLRRRFGSVPGWCGWLPVLALVASPVLAGCSVAKARPATAPTIRSSLPAEVTTTTVPPPITVPVTPLVPPASAEVTALRHLPVDDLARGRPGYARDLFPTWLDLDHDGCDARQETLIDESLTKTAVTARCRVVAGHWRSLYDNVEVSDPGQLDVDHVVPLAEAWRSGAFQWDAVRRAAYANDVTVPDHLIAVTAASNRAKSDSSPDLWRPPARGSWCRYATAWVEVKRRWSLTTTTAERDALGQMLGTC